MKTLPSYLDRYPAKMVTRLAEKIVDKYVDTQSVVLDPFCGSGAILKASQNKLCKVLGIDINPYAILLSSVKLYGFNPKKAEDLLSNIINESKAQDSILSTSYNNIAYWFTPKTLNKLYRLRYTLKQYKIPTSNDGLAILLAFALTIRLVSKADQRSPKPFISKIAIEERKGRHFDPYEYITKILKRLCDLYGNGTNISEVELFCKNLMDIQGEIDNGSVTHIITSPPYINAQDYFRNSKLELYFLEGILPFVAEDIKNSFIGTERGQLNYISSNCTNAINSCLNKININNKRLNIIVYKYFIDMELALKTTYKLLKPNGTLILVCGDNVVNGQSIKTWQILNEIAIANGYTIMDSFKDQIIKRSLAPKRMGHKSLIKDETVTIFKKLI